MSGRNRNSTFSRNGIGIGKTAIATTCFVAILIACLTTAAIGGIRAPGKYSGVVIFDRWGGCILFSGVYLMYVSESAKDQLRKYEGQAVEIDALEVKQPNDPGDGLIRRLKIIGPAESKHAWYRVEDISLEARPVAIKKSLGVEITITNRSEKPVRIDSSQIGLALLSRRMEGAQTAADGPSMAVITRVDVFKAHGGRQSGGGKQDVFVLLSHS